MKTRLLRNLHQKAARLRALGRDTSAVAMVEFAFAAPLLLAMGLLGT